MRADVFGFVPPIVRVVAVALTPCCFEAHWFVEAPWPVDHRAVVFTFDEVGRYRAGPISAPAGHRLLIPFDDGGVSISAVAWSPDEFPMDGSKCIVATGGEPLPAGMVSYESPFVRDPPPELVAGGDRLRLLEECGSAGACDAIRDKMETVALGEFFDLATIAPLDDERALAFGQDRDFLLVTVTLGANDDISVNVAEREVDVAGAVFDGKATVVAALGEELDSLGFFSEDGSPRRAPSLSLVGPIRDVDLTDDGLVFVSGLNGLFEVDVQAGSTRRRDDLPVAPRRFAASRRDRIVVMSDKRELWMLDGGDWVLERSSFNEQLKRLDMNDSMAVGGGASGLLLIRRSDESWETISSPLLIEAVLLAGPDRFILMGTSDVGIYAGGSWCPFELDTQPVDIALSPSGRTLFIAGTRGTGDANESVVLRVPID